MEKHFKKLFLIACLVFNYIYIYVIFLLIFFIRSNLLADCTYLPCTVRIVFPGLEDLPAKCKFLDLIPSKTNPVAQLLSMKFP